MVLNIVFLLGGIGIGYLIRGEIQRRKSDKAMVNMINAGGELVKTILSMSNDEEKKEEEDEISFNDLEDLFHIENNSNSTDETIKL